MKDAYMRFFLTHLQSLAGASLLTIVGVVSLAVENGREFSAPPSEATFAEACVDGSCAKASGPGLTTAMDKAPHLYAARVAGILGRRQDAQGSSKESAAVSK
jgi:hypothetical protein